MKMKKFNKTTTSKRKLIKRLIDSLEDKIDRIAVLMSEYPKGKDFKKVAQKLGA
ncbi:hypothetical protein HY086_04785 [Candidatus Gottesmanbacteria bacterium]|nr:hypothetical protein [Candidatus Gottesmanbacteria bacterium]